jgi:predicted DNA-binding transcriptional regulator AlpA
MTNRKSATDLAQSDLLSLEQIASRIGCSVRAIQQYRQRGDFPDPLRVGPRMVRWPASAIEAWLAR